MEKKLTILITNDDGIYAPGIKHLWHSLKDFANLFVVAPHADQSAVGLGITVRTPLEINKTHWHDDTTAWAVTGTPADCIKMALSTLLDFSPDLIVSGINKGANAGRNLLYSGTVAGAIEGVLHGIPSIAFSYCEYLNPNFHLIEQYIPKIVEYVLNHPLPEGTLLNVNFPRKVGDFIKGFKMAKQGLGFWGENPKGRQHPVSGSSYYWLGSQLMEFEEHEESDTAWLNQGYITAVPVHINEFTDYTHLKEKKESFEEFLNAHFMETASTLS